MDIKKFIRNDLWVTIKNTYKTENFTHSTVDAMNYLSNILREKSGLDNDGVTLVSKALGGNNPLIKLNKLETETEKNVQKGILHILMGFYEAIRNPRSHEQHEDINDTKNNTDSIIIFINYLADIIDKSKGSFMLETFLEQVFDDDFVTNKKYATLLSSEIPKKKRFDTLITIYRKKQEGNIYSISLLINEIINSLTEIQKTEFISIVSDELKTARDDKTFIHNLHIIPTGFWSKLSEISRLRVENVVIKSIKSGKADKDKVSNGALATWARQHFDSFDFDNIFTLGNALIKKLNSEDWMERNYVTQYFFDFLPKVITNSWQIGQCVEAISNKIKEGDEEIKQQLINSFFKFSEEWRDKFKTKLDGVVDFDNIEIPF
jgi:uncharacterized protein (TIGR02391 family)